MWIVEARDDPVNGHLTLINVAPTGAPAAAAERLSSHGF
jgi:hypothetical protein